jgi:hypothetical protein
MHLVSPGSIDLMHLLCVGILRQLDVILLVKDDVSTRLADTT